VRDAVLLESAVAAPQASFGGEAWETLVLDVAASKLDREGATKALRKLLRAQARASMRWTA